MKKPILYFIGISFLFGINFSCGKRAYKRELSQKLQEKIDSIQQNPAIDQATMIYQPDMIAQLYQKSGQFLSPRWNSRENIDELLEFIRDVHLEGLNPEDYHLSKIDQLTKTIVDNDLATIEEFAQLEILLTDAYLLLASHLAGGKTHPETIDPLWNAAHRDLQIDWDLFIDSTLRTKRITKTLHSLTPNHKEYANLKIALDRYQKIQNNGGWAPFRTNLRKLEKEMTHPDVALLRQRISITQGEIPIDTDDDFLFDQSLHDQVVIFQNRNGLTNDGVVGAQSIEAMNIMVEERIASIEANLERWRWLSEELGDRYILVNIANFDLQLIENGHPIFTTEAIVGRPYRKTPVFSSVMTYLVFNPDWTVPPTILRNDVIPAVLSNPNYLSEKKMRIIAHNGQEINPYIIDWQQVAQSGLPHMIRQDPGPENALGRVKFMFPNHHNVYIHDTPTRNLFRHTERTFSSGCIRVNKPLALAEILLDANPGWTADRINQTIKEGNMRTVHFQKGVPVHLIYLTAWADDTGTVYFRKDIYDRDRTLLLALKHRLTDS